MKRFFITAAICVCISLVLFPLLTDSADALSTPRITSVYQTDLEKQCVRVQWTSDNTGYFSYELSELNSGKSWNFAGSVNYYYIQNLSAGQTLRLMLRAYDESSGYSKFSSIWTITVQSGYGNNNYGYEEQQGSQYNWKTITEGVGYSDYTVDGDAVYYEFTTGSAANAKYQFECYGKNDKLVYMYMLRNGADPSDDDAWSVVAYGNKNSSSREVKTLSLRPNTTYRLRVYCVTIGWGDNLSHATGGLPYWIKVTKILPSESNDDISPDQQNNDSSYEFIPVINKGKIVSLKAGKKKVKVKIKKIANADIYQYAFKKKGSSYKYNYSTNRTKTFTGLKAKKIYYFKVRGVYFDNDGDPIYGKWSNVRKIRVKAR